MDINWTVKWKTWKVEATLGYRELTVRHHQHWGWHSAHFRITLLFAIPADIRNSLASRRSAREIYSSLYWQLLCRTLYGFPDSINGSVFCMPGATGLWLLLISFKTPHPQLCSGYLQTGSVHCSLPTPALGSFPEAFSLCRMQPKQKFRSLSFPFLSLQELCWLFPVSPVTEQPETLSFLLQGNTIKQYKTKPNKGKKNVKQNKINFPKARNVVSYLHYH